MDIPGVALLALSAGWPPWSEACGRIGEMNRHIEDLHNQIARVDEEIERLNQKKQKLLERLSIRIIHTEKELDPHEEFLGI